MKINLTYQFIPGTRVEEYESGDWALITELGEYPIQSSTGALEKTLLHLLKTPMTEGEMTDYFISQNGTQELALLYYFLEQIRSSRLLDMKIGPLEAPLAAIVPQSMLFKLKTKLPEPGKTYVLSRFAFSRRYDEEMRLENSSSNGCFTILSKEVSDLIHLLHNPLNLSEFIEQQSPAMCEVIALMMGLGYITEVISFGKTAEDDDPRLHTWEFHDLLFHSRSRMGRHDYDSGATFPYKDTMEPLPAFKEMPEDLEVIPLYKPQIDDILEKDPSFTLVMESRRSVRGYGEKPITAEQLGEFLFRCARVRNLTLKEEGTDRLYDMTNRPYPNGGASYELELYITVDSCEGLERGIYHYDPMQHVLRLIQPDEQYVKYLVHDAWMSAAKTVSPQVLITYAPRFQRLSWKYRGMGYSASLKNVGALYQTMYLVATAMGLAPCGLGNGNAELFCKATGNDYYLESSTAEFMLGSLPESDGQGKS